ncbi:GntR family transcriptional regulator [Nonomuraea sp. NN258]|nr:GntR family transcriptional regulator [Nonomuraea antri]
MSSRPSTASTDRSDAPYLRIVEELRKRIATGELAAGDKLPSTRQITRDWGVAMATATKVLSRLQEEGLARAVPGVGTVVTGRDQDPPARPPQDLARQRIVRAAIQIADGEGLPAVSMRRLATELGVSAMSLYRHVAGKDELVHLMADAAYAGDPLPARPPRGWRAQVELSLRLQWRIYRRHPWLAQAISLTRPEFVPGGMAHTEWLLRAVHGLGLDPNAMLHVTVSLANFVRGTAASLEPEEQARTDTGLTDDEWIQTREPDLTALFADGAYPTLAGVLMSPDLNLDLDSLFEFGLNRHLDGLAVLLARTRDGGTRTRAPYGSHATRTRG